MLSLCNNFVIRIARKALESAEWNCSHPHTRTLNLNLQHSYLFSKRVSDTPETIEENQEAQKQKAT